MLSKCTHSERWGTVEEPGISEDQAEDYILHLRECPFHAKAEKSGRKIVSSLSEIARGVQEKRLLRLSEEDAIQIHRGQIRERKSHGRARMKTLSVRVNSRERTLVDLCKENRVTIEVTGESWISVWRPKEGNEEDDLYLAGEYLSNPSSMTNGATRRSVSLESGAVISFGIERTQGSTALFTVEFSEANRSRPALSILEMTKDRARAALQSLAWGKWLGKAAVAFIILMVVIIVLRFIPGRGQMENGSFERKQQEKTESKEPGLIAAVPEPSPVKKSLRSDPTILSGVVREPSSHPATKFRRPESVTENRTSRTREHNGVGQRIYIGNGFDAELRQALNDELLHNGIALVERDREAGAILVANRTRGKRLVIKLKDRSQETQWWMEVEISKADPTNVKAIAEKIVKGMLSESK
jgi:hypothetical protein